MKEIDKLVMKNRMKSPLVVLALLAAMAPAADARHRAPTPAEQPVTIVAHVALSGSPTKQMNLQENDGRQYLYIGANSNQGVTVVDVTNPGQPNVVKLLAWPNQASSGRLQLVSAGLALAESPDSGSMAADPVPSTRTVKILDLSDPANPRALLSFSGVTSTLNDEAHNLVYITNSEGLWIVRNNQALGTFARSHACTSDDAYNEVASCR
jgi:hypothetical protein